MSLRAGLLLGAWVAGCSPSAASDARVTDAARDVLGEVSTGQHDAARDAPDARHDAPLPEAGPDASYPTTALIRLANWSPDAPGVDICLAPRGTSSWNGPLLAATLGSRLLGNLTVVDLGPPFDASTTAAADADAGPTGVVFPRLSPYVAVPPGAYDVRVVTAGASDCSAGLLPDTSDLTALAAGTTETLALVGDVVDQGTDPAVSLAAFSDDIQVPAAQPAVRFINAVPSVAAVTFASGTVMTDSVSPYLIATQFGATGVDTPMTGLDMNDYLVVPPIAHAVWSLINANGGVVTIASVDNVSVPAGEIATVVGVGGESGPLQTDVGILLCADTPPIGPGETSMCKLYAATSGVCPHCP